MIVADVSLEQIDLSDERFRISEELDSKRLEESLRAIGIQQPVLLIRRAEQRFAVVAGFRRARVWKRLGHSTLCARISEVAERGPLSTFEIALWENLGHRELNPLEKARVLHTLKTLCDVSQEELIGKYMPLLGLDAHKNVLRSYLRVHAAHPVLRRMFLEGHLTLATAERLSEMPGQEQARLAALLENVRWSASRQRETLDLLEDLAAIGASSIVSVLDRPEILDIVRDATLSAFQRGERIHAVLHRLRNPRLAQAEARFHEEKTKLGLPGSVRITPSPFFESRRVRFEFECSDVESLRSFSEALARASRAENAKLIFQVV